MGGRGWRGVVLLLGDLFVLNCALWLGLAVRRGEVAPMEFFLRHPVPFNLLFIIWVLAFYSLGFYDLRRLRALPWLVRSILIAGVVNWLLGTTYFYFFYPYLGLTPKTNLLLVLLIGHTGVIGWRRVMVNLMRARTLRQRVVFLGEAAQVREFRRELKQHPQLGFVPVQGLRSDVDVVVADGRWVESHWDQAREAIGDAIRRRIPVTNMSSFYEELFGKVTPEHAGNLSWMLGSVLSQGARFYVRLKRVFDAATSAIALVLLAPLLALVCLAIRLADGSPVLFKQRRVGFMGREFFLWKFRTMVANGGLKGGFTSKVEVDRRVTFLGSILRRFRIDELPQFWNVVRGDMSLVGPRPEWHKEVEVLEKMIPQYHLRHMVVPGITGWAQLNFRATNNPGDSVEKLHYDLYYVKNVSLALDMSILLRTVRRVFIRDIWIDALPRSDLRLPRAIGRMMAEFPAMIGRKRS